MDRRLPWPLVGDNVWLGATKALFKLPTTQVGTAMISCGFQVLTMVQSGIVYPNLKRSG